MRDLTPMLHLLAATQSGKDEILTQSGIVTSLLTNPIWVVKTRMQLQKTNADGNYRGLFGISFPFSLEMLSERLREKKAFEDSIEESFPHSLEFLTELYSLWRTKNYGNGL